MPPMYCEYKTREIDQEGLIGLSQFMYKDTTFRRFYMELCQEGMIPNET